MTVALDHHYIHSTLRERIVEHVFVGEALRRLWQLGIFDVEVLRSEFDAGGYDLVMSRGSIIRHIQFKSVMQEGKAARTSVSLKLADKPSGCIIWMVVSPELELKSFLWFGSGPGVKLPDLGEFSVTKHSKGNADGIKFERPNHRIIPRGKFDALGSLDGVLEKLFGALTPTTVTQSS
ncbi:hypothetical protein [Sphingomonas sp. LT1P40]|uniref:hypothetical protein n=1 Tax=Alteristakelama amylovorans TaxID=3096166 RepID=UPI002FCAE4CD